jgi:hypothetical protein
MCVVVHGGGKHGVGKKGRSVQVAAVMVSGGNEDFAAWDFFLGVVAEAVAAAVKKARDEALALKSDDEGLSPDEELRLPIGMNDERRVNFSDRCKGLW